MNLTQRQRDIVALVKAEGPLTGEEIGKKLQVSKGTIRPDLSVLTMIGYLSAKPNVGYIYTRPTSAQAALFIKNILVEERMSLPVVLEGDSSVYDGIVCVFLENIGTVFITKEGYLDGVVSRKDLLRSCLGSMDLNKTPLSVIMTRMPNVKMVRPKDTMYDAAKLINDSDIDGLPVVEEDEGGYRVVGRITKTNINKLVVELGDENESE